MTRKNGSATVPSIPPPAPKRRTTIKLDAVEVEDDVMLVWLLRPDGKAFVDLALVLSLLESPQPLEAYTKDNSFLTIQYTYPKPPSWDDFKGDFIEIKHLTLLEEHAKRTNSNLQKAINTILRSLPRET